MSRPLFIEGMHGLGDNLYQRAVLREFTRDRQVWLSTSWPQLYADLPNVHPVKPSTRLRTQAKNVARGYRWHSPPVGGERKRWHYVGAEGSILESLCRGLGMSPRPLDMTGPAFEPFAPCPEPYVVIRPATLREEWRADSRNPQPEYLAQAADLARSRGFRVVSVADLRAGEEWALEPLPVADITYHAGELPIEQLLALVAGASALIGGVGWLLPAALAYDRPLLLVYGGWGYYNHPGRILGPLADSSRVFQVLPDNFCMCQDKAHHCPKEITDYAQRIDQWHF